MLLPAMNSWFAKAAILVFGITIVVIRAPHGQRSRAIKVVKSGKGPLEVFLLTLAWIGFFVPLIWIVTPVLGFADYPLLPIPFIAGVLCLVFGLTLFYRSHADLGTNWSITLEVREKHQLVTQGIYRRVRGPVRPPRRRRGADDADGIRE